MNVYQTIMNVKTYLSNEINISEYYNCVDTLDILPILDEDTLHGTTEGYIET